MPILAYKSPLGRVSGQKSTFDKQLWYGSIYREYVPDRQDRNTMWLARVESWNTRFPSQNWRALCLHRAFDIFFPGIGVSIDTPFYSTDFPIFRTVNRLIQTSRFNSEIIFLLFGLTVFAITANSSVILSPRSILFWIIKIFSERKKKKQTMFEIRRYSRSKR